MALNRLNISSRGLGLSNVTSIFTSNAISLPSCQSGLRNLTRRGLRTSCVLSNAASGGSGLGNVKDQILPSVHDDEDVRSPSFRTLREPRTVSLIPCPMTFGQPFTGTDMGPEVGGGGGSGGVYVCVWEGAAQLLQL